MHRGRIINGVFKRRVIKTPKCLSTRPTSDIVKEMIFNVLIHRFGIDFSKTGVLDIFAGSGALGIESISLGSSSVLFVDSSSDAINCIKENLRELGISNAAKIFHKNAMSLDKNIALSCLEKNEGILIFMDPPYGDKNLLISQIDLLKSIFEKMKNILIVIETDQDLNIKNFEILHKKQHGKTIILFGTINI